MTAMMTRFGRLIVPLAVIALLATACSGGEDLDDDGGAGRRPGLPRSI